MTGILLAAVWIGANPNQTDWLAQFGNPAFRVGGTLTSIAWSPDGKQLATGSRDRTLTLWDVESGRELRSWQGTSHYVPATAFSPSENDAGQLLAFFLGDSKIHMVEATTGREIWTRHDTFVRHLVFSSDGRWLATSIAGGGVAVRDARTGSVQYTLPGFEHHVFAAHGKYLLTAKTTSGNGSIHWHDFEDGKEVRSVSLGPVRTHRSLSVTTQGLIWTGETRDGVHARHISRGGKSEKTWPGVRLADAVEDRFALATEENVQIYRHDQNEPIARLPVRADILALSKDGERLAVGVGHRIQIWDIDQNKQIHPEGFDGPIIGLSWVADGTRILVGHRDGVRIWDQTSGELVGKLKLPGRLRAVAPLDGETLLTADDSTLRAWRVGPDDWNGPIRPRPIWERDWWVEAKQPEQRPESNFPIWADQLAIARDGDALAWAAPRWRSDLLRLHDGQVTDRRDPLGEAVAVAFSPVRDELLILSRDASLSMWRISATDKRMLWAERVQRPRQGAIAFSPDGSRVAVADGTRLLILDADTGKLLGGILGDWPTGAVSSLAFSPNGYLLAAGLSQPGESFLVWEARTGREVGRFTGGRGGINRIAFSPDAKAVAVAGLEGIVRVRDGLFRHPDDPEMTLAKSWEALADDLPARAYQAMIILGEAGDRAVRTIREGMVDASQDVDLIRGWIVDLDSPNFRKRERATHEVLAFGSRSLEPLRAALEANPSPEARRRIGELLKLIEAKNRPSPLGGLVGERLRLFRAVLVLKTIESDAAQKLLEEIAQSDPDSPVGIEARAALGP